MNLNDGINLTNAIRDLEKVDAESNPTEHAEAVQDLVNYINSYIHLESLSGGWERQLKQFNDRRELRELETPYEKDGDLYVGRWRVHLVYDGEIDGLGDVFPLPGMLKEHTRGLPMVEFYDLTADPEKYPKGKFSSGHFMSNLLAMGPYACPEDSIENKKVLYIGIPDQPLRGNALKAVATFVCKKRDEILKARDDDRAYRELLRRNPDMVENGQLIIFDASAYQGRTGLKMAFEECVNDLVFSEVLPEFTEEEAKEEVRSSMSEDDLLEYAMTREKRALKSEVRDIDRFLGLSRENPNRGQYLITHEITRRSGEEVERFNMYSSMETLLEGSPAKGEESSEFKNCRVVKIWDEDGRMFIRGANTSGGTMDLEIRQATCEADLRRSTPEELWGNRQHAALPRYASLALGGYPKIENVVSIDDETTVASIEDLAREASSATMAINRPSINSHNHEGHSTQKASENTR